MSLNLIIFCFYRQCFLPVRKQISIHESNFNSSLANSFNFVRYKYLMPCEKLNLYKAELDWVRLVDIQSIFISPHSSVGRALDLKKIDLVGSIPGL